MQWFCSLIIYEWVYAINPTTLQSIQFVEVLNGFCWVVLHLLSHALPVGTACSSGGFRWLRIICKELAPKIQIIIRAFLSVPPRKLFTYPWWVTHSEVSWLVSPFGLKPFYIDTPPPSQLELILTRRDIRDGSAALEPVPRWELVVSAPIRPALATTSCY